MTTKSQKAAARSICAAFLVKCKIIVALHCNILSKEGKVFMAKETTLTVRMDDDIRKEFDAFCSKVGLTASGAVNVFIRAVLRERKIPFEITEEADPFYSESNLLVLRKSIEQND